MGERGERGYILRAHRFYVGDKLKLENRFWVHDPDLLWQWGRVMRFQPGQEIILFDGRGNDRLYDLKKIDKNEARLELITELKVKAVKKHIYLLWSLLKKDKNDFVIQKCTELGVANLVPLICDRTIKKDFNLIRAKKIIIEASEQCGRSYLPSIREPLHLKKAITEYKDKAQLVYCDQAGASALPSEDGSVAVMIGPEGGWSADELGLFSRNDIRKIGLNDFTLRAETAAVSAVAKLTG